MSGFFGIFDSCPVNVEIAGTSFCCGSGRLWLRYCGQLREEVECLGDGQWIKSAEGQRNDPRLGHTDLDIGGRGYRAVAWTGFTGAASL